MIGVEVAFNPKGVNVDNALLNVTFPLLLTHRDEYCVP
jgi:hypothetical protein